MHQPGIEPGPHAWKARILTIELSMLFCTLDFLVRESNPGLLGESQLS